VNAYVGEEAEQLPWPACQACQFAGLWIGLLLALVVLVYEVLDESIMLAASECTVVVVHLALVGGGLLVGIVLAAQRTRAWMGEVRGRNRRYSRSASDSTVFAADYKAVPSDGVIGSLWGQAEPTAVFGVPDSMGAAENKCARCSVTCWLTVPFALLGAWHIVAFALLLWMTSTVDTGTLPTDPAEPASLSLSGITDKVTVEWVRRSHHLQAPVQVQHCDSLACAHTLACRSAMAWCTCALSRSRTCSSDKATSPRNFDCGRWSTSAS
jgi:hypothetical protein